MDAFSHANEALSEKKNTPHSDMLSYEVIRLVSRWLPVAVKDGKNMDARENLSLAANYAGISFNESGVHIGHSTAHALGHTYHIAHGIGCALVTPPTIEFVAKKFPEKTKKIGEAMGKKIDSNDPATIGKTVADAVRALMKEIGIPSLKDQKITKQQVLDLKPKIYQEPLNCLLDNRAQASSRLRRGLRRRGGERG
jgi:alcohol dehydrogenase